MSLRHSRRTYILLTFRTNFSYSRSPLSEASIFHLPYLPSESTLSRIFLLLEAPPPGFFAGVYIIANHKRAVVLYCLCHMQRMNRGQPSPLAAIFFLGFYANVSMFSRKIKEPPTYLSSKNNKIRDRGDSRVQLVWRLRVIGSWLQPN